jgi:hypothetical protein
MRKSEIEVGTPVIYWGIIKKETGERFNPFKTVISSEPWELGSGETVCKVVGKSGGVAISHLDPITPGSLMAAKLSGLTEISDDDFKSATEKFFNDKLQTQP